MTSNENWQGKVTAEYWQGPAVVEHWQGPAAVEHWQGPPAVESWQGAAAEGDRLGPAAVEHRHGTAAVEHLQGTAAAESWQGAAAEGHRQGPAAVEHRQGPAAAESWRGTAAEEHRQGAAAAESWQGGPATDLHVVSWNVNGIRARWPRLSELLTCERPDVVCLQETRCSEWHFPRARLREMGYQSRHSPGRQHGGGVAILVREDHAITDHRVELGRRRELAEGHWIELTTEGVTIASVYVPAGKAPGESSDAGKRAFLEAVARHACDEYARPLLIAGDFNVAPTDEDVYEPSWFESSYQTGEAERANLRAIIDEGELVDVYRTLHPTERGYTCWEQREGHYGRDYGMRIDLVLASESLARCVGACAVNHTYRRGFRPSNHAPIDVELAGVRTGAFGTGAHGPDGQEDELAWVRERAFAAHGVREETLLAA